MRKVLWRLWLLVFLLLIVSAFFPAIQEVSVSGNDFYSDADIQALARAYAGQPLLWVSVFSARALGQDPWIERAEIVRQWPNRISIYVWERKPFFLRGEQVLALDGTVLPNAPITDSLVKLFGWGDRPVSEVFDLARLLAEREPKVIHYSPSGFDVRFDKGSLFTPSLGLLRQHWSAFASQSAQQVSVYSWGVSVAP